MKRMAIAVMASALLVSAGLSAQTAPSFVGKWTLVADPAAAPPAGGGGGGRGGGRGGMGGGFCAAECTIAQDGTTLTVTRMAQGTEMKTMYKLDGSESKNTMTMGGNEVVSTSMAKWDGAKLVVTTKMNMGDAPIETKYTLSLVGGELVVDRTGGREGTPPQTQKYKKG
jgi:hypothetical protein